MSKNEEIAQLKEAIAAEREKVKTLTDALTSIATDDQTLWGTIARQTLAKVNETAQPDV